MKYSINIYNQSFLVLKGLVLLLIMMFIVLLILYFIMIKILVMIMILFVIILLLLLSVLLMLLLLFFQRKIFIIIRRIMILGFGHIRGFHGISVIRIPWIKKLQRIWHILYFVSHFHIIMFVSHYWHDLSSLNLFINHFLSLVRNLLNPLVTILSLLSF